MLTDYYRKRAREYDTLYATAAWQSELPVLHDWLMERVCGKAILEVAAGTGYWTQVLAPAAATITATDLNAETLAVAARRDYAGRAPRLLTGDAYRLDAIPGEFDLVFCGFWWSHIPRADVARFLAGVCARVAPGTPMLIMDNRYVEGSVHPIARTGPEGDTYQLRRLHDGRQYEVLKNFPGRDQLASDLAGAATGLDWTALEYYWLLTCVLT